jgi:hypothetical protein
MHMLKPILFLGGLGLLGVLVGTGAGMTMFHWLRGGLDGWIAGIVAGLVVAVLTFALGLAGTGSVLDLLHKHNPTEN